MTKIYTKIIAVLFAISLTSVAFGQNITGAVVSPNPTSCISTSVTVAAVQLCINYTFVGTSHTINGNVITVTLDWSNSSPICLGALSFLNPTENLGLVPAGTYTLNVVAQLNGTIQNNSTQSLTIVSCCSVLPSIQAASTNVCIGDSLLLMNNSQNATSVYWVKNGVNFSSSDSVMLHFPTAGVVPIRLVATNGSCSDSVTYNVTVNNYPNVNLGPDVIFCAGQSILINGATSGGLSYSWNTGTVMPNLTVSTGGTYSLTVSNNGCIDRDTIVVTAIASPSVALGADSIICQGTSAILNAATTGTGITYLWSNGATTPSITVNSSGIYNVTVTNSTGCSKSDSKEIIVELLPIPNLGDDVTLCDGDSIILDGNATDISNFLWSTGQTTQTITVNSPNIYSVTATTANGCSGSDDVVVSFASISIILMDTIDLANASPVILDAGNPGATYLWSTGETTQSISIDTIGSYSVTITNAAGCSAVNTMTVVNTTSTNGLKYETVKVFPNPTNDFLVITATESKFATAIIINSVGQIMGQISISNTQQIDVQDLSSGLYFLQFQNQNSEIVGTARFVKY